MQLGLVLNKPSYFDPSQMFVNLLDQGGAIADPLGHWLYRHASGYTRPGEYLVSADGTGTLAFSDADVPASMTNMQFGPGEERYVFEVKQQTGGRVRISKSDAEDPIRNIRICPVGLSDGAAGEFDPVFMANIAGAWALRSCAFVDIVPNSIVARNKAGKEVSWATADVPRWRQFIRLCNANRSRAWLNFPHTMVEEYGVELGRLFAAEYDHELGAPIAEYSLEVWNTASSYVPAQVWLAEQGKAIGIPGVHQAYAYFVGKCWDAFEVGYGRPCNRVFANQFMNESLVKANIKFARENNIRFDSISPAVYVLQPSLEWDLIRKAWRKDFPEIVERLVLGPMGDTIPSKLVPKMQTWADIADAEGVQLFAYELGQSLIVNKPPAAPGEDPAAAKAEVDAIARYVQRSAGMGVMTEKLLEAMNAHFAGGNYCGYCGPDPFTAVNGFGMIEHADDRTAKLDVFREHIHRNNV
jgi:hypothetical protein